MAALFYSYQTGGDVLYVVIDPLTVPDKTVSSGEVTALYKGETLVGVNLFHFSKKAKIFSIGLIPMPEEPLMKVVNAELANAGLEALSITSSGYKVATVLSIEEHPLDEKKSIVDLSLRGEKVETSTRYGNLNVGDKVVVVTDGTIRFDGTQFKKSVIRNIPQDVEICSEKDLHVGDDFKSALIANEREEGSDFFA